MGDPDDKKDEGKHTANHGPCVPSDEIEVEPFIHNTSVADDGGSQEMTGGDFPVSPLSKKTKDGCAVGAMPFEGKCVNKGKIDRILERRERKALKRVQKAHKPQQMADAAGELIEQQIAQMGKAEDDLDEILEQLRAEDLEERREKKEGP